MQRFHFRLEMVRRWRLEQLGLEELKLRRILSERSALEAAKNQIQAEAAETIQQTLGKSSLAAIELESLDSYRLYSRARIRQIESQQQQCELRIAEQRNKVLEARRQFELLERLRQKAWNEWRAAGIREQEALAAELFLAKSIRARGRA